MLSLIFFVEGGAKKEGGGAYLNRVNIKTTASEKPETRFIYENGTVLIVTLIKSETYKEKKYKKK